MFSLSRQRTSRTSGSEGLYCRATPRSSMLGGSIRRMSPIFEALGAAESRLRNRLAATSIPSPGSRRLLARAGEQRSADPGRPRPNLLVKIPATDAGVPAIEEMTARGYAINVTLIFSLMRHRQVAEAYLRGLERLIASRGDPSRVHSVASFFVSRVDSETDRRLAETDREDLKGRLGIANAKLAYQQYKALFQGERWDDLDARGATAQRCLWASTSVKDPSLRDTLYVEELIGPETISTMPEETIRAFQNHGRVEVRLESDLDEAQYLFNKLYAAGVDYDDVVATLEREGIEKFVASFNELLKRVADKRRHLSAAA
jgi:transaldolase